MIELLTYWPSLSLLVISVIAYGIKELWQHGKLIWMASSVMSFGHVDFWGSESWKRKYKYDNGTPLQSPNTFYYRFFKIKYKERFPLSATLLVSLTDGMHLMQFICVNGICLAASLLFPNTLLTFVIVRGIFGIVFSIVYKLLSR